MQWPFLRDLLLFFGGMAGAIHETLISGAERPTLLILFAAMMGLPAFLQQQGIAPEKRDDSPAKKPKRKRHLVWVDDSEIDDPQTEEQKNAKVD